MKKCKLDENQIRQGDVMAIYVDKSDTPPVEVKLGQKVILAHGEVTGHTHALRIGIENPAIPVFDASAERYIQLIECGKLSHEEHEAAIFRKGTIEIGVQVEAGPHNMLRKVSD